jgi:branched-chain amino acid transport system substrate-binding protein
MLRGGHLDVEEKNMRRRLTIALLTVGAVALLAGTGTVAASARHASAGQYNIGIVYSRTGLLASYGAQYLEGLEFGLQYATSGTNKVNGKSINLTLVDDKTDPATGVSAEKDLIGQGYKVIAGAVSSGVALQEAPIAAQNQVLFISGPAASDAITGLNKYTFRSGRQTYEDVATAATYLDGTGKNVVVFAQDSAFGQGNYAAVKAIVGGKGHTVTPIYVPLTATDFTPFAQQVKQAKPDLIYIAWAGTTAGAMWTALDQQGVFDSVKSVVTGLDQRSTYASFGPAIAKIHFLSHYVYQAPTNKVNDWLRAQLRKKSQFPDLFTPDGFVAGQMIVHALQKGDYDVGKMISALEGWKFLAPKGWQAIRPQDHAMLQPMFRVTLQKVKNVWTPKVLGTASAYQTAPPITTSLQS